MGGLRGRVVGRFGEALVRGRTVDPLTPTVRRIRVDERDLPFQGGIGAFIRRGGGGAPFWRVREENRVRARGEHNGTLDMFGCFTCFFFWI